MAKRISMGSWAFVSDQGHGESEPIADLLASLRELGFDGVELGAHDLPTVDDRDRLKAALAGQGLEVSAFVPDLRKLVWGSPCQAFIAGTPVRWVALRSADER